MNIKEIRKTLTIPIPTINYAYQKNVSYSQYQTYSQCPNKWYHNSVKKSLPSKPSINFSFGTAIHVTLQNYFQKMFDESGAAADKMDLEEIFQTEFIKEYENDLKKNGSHFSTPEELKEFYLDGVAILRWFKKHRGEYFSTRKFYLLGIELDIIQQLQKNLFLKGKIDLIFYDEVLDKIIIYDIKTSTRGWQDKDKKDKTKTAQLVLYKKFLSEQYGFNIENIDVEYFIVKRKIWEKSEFPQKRIQTFKPASGKTTINKIMKEFQSFLDSCFNEEGKPIEKEYEKKPSKLCERCIFNKTEFCKL